MKRLLSGIASILALPFTAAQPTDFGSCPMGGMMYGGYGAWPMLFSWLFGILTLVALVLLIIWLLKQLKKK